MARLQIDVSEECKSQITELKDQFGSQGAVVQRSVKLASRLQKYMPDGELTVVLPDGKTETIVFL